MKTNQSSLLSSLLSYVLGVIVGLLLLGMAAWADMEANFYGFDRLANAGLRGFSCPVLMTQNETRTISLQLSNPTDRRISPSVRTEISTPVLPQQFVETIRIEPGESRRLEWPVGPENRDLQRFIFAKALLYSSHPLPSQEATCGIFVVNLPGSGRVILPVLVALAVLAMGWGIYHMNKFRISNEWLARYMGSMTFIAVMIAIGLFISFRGGWVPGLLILLVVILVIVILLSSMTLSERKKVHR
jgi:hypothetical protein